MEITEEILAAIPADHVRVPVDEFAAFWRLAESECVRLVMASPLGQPSWEASYASAAMKTVRWLAVCEVPMGMPSSPMWTAAPAPLLPYSGVPLGKADNVSMRELADEYRKLMQMFPDGYRTEGMPPRPGYLEGVRDTYEWARLHAPAPRLGVPRTESAPSQ